MKMGNNVKSDSNLKEAGSSGWYFPKCRTRLMTVRSIHRMTSLTCMKS